MIALVQPFGLQAAGGGARILRALLQDAPMPFLSLCTTPQQPPATDIGREIHLPTRPYFGRIESTRLGSRLYISERLLAARFKQQLEAVCKAEGVTGIHVIAHSMDFWYSYQVAQKLGLPIYLSVHDDIGFALQGKPEYDEGMKHFPRVWQNAQARFVISDAMGKEYCARYGQKPYAIVTDGLSEVPAQPALRASNNLRVYFMGLFHLSYEDNLRAFLKALSIMHDASPDLNIALTCRCGTLPFNPAEYSVPVTVLPLAAEATVAQDLQVMDVLYLPLPFGAQYEDFVRFSLSTKMVTYLGSGLPILYHGPAQSAAGELLVAHHAAGAAPSLDTQVIVQALTDVKDKSATIVQNALKLARQDFLLAVQRQRFWSALNSPFVTSTNV